MATFNSTFLTIARALIYVTVATLLSIISSDCIGQVSVLHFTATPPSALDLARVIAAIILASAIHVHTIARNEPMINVQT